MGVYIFRSKHGHWIKVGHHKVRAQAPNVYYRVIRRGFYSCKRPDEIKDRVGFDDLELLHWYPNLTSKDEHILHSLFRSKYEHIGEWYLSCYLNNIVDTIEEYGGKSEYPSNEDLEDAYRWLLLMVPLYVNGVRVIHTS